MSSEQAQNPGEKEAQEVHAETMMAKANEKKLSAMKLMEAVGFKYEEQKKIE